MSAAPSGQRGGVDPEEALEVLFRDLGTGHDGLSEREAARRLVQYGPNELQRRSGVRWPRRLVRQLIHPLAVLLWGAAALALVADIIPIAIAIVVVILLNAAFAFVQELQAERAVEALRYFLPAQSTVMRGGRRFAVPASGVVPGDIIVIDEGDRVSADARLTSGALELDMSALSGESAPVLRSARYADSRVPILQARELVFSGTNATGGGATGVVFATGMGTELGRIAALSERTGTEESPLEIEVRRLALIIAAVAVGLGVAFVPVATLGAGLPLTDAVLFSIGLLVGNVPEGLLPVITLALAVGVRGLVRRGALVKRLSAVEALGAASVICTDKTGTLTQNRMAAEAVWIDGARSALDAPEPGAGAGRLGDALAACSNADLEAGAGDPTELGLLAAAHSLGRETTVADREAARRGQMAFDPELKRMSTIDAGQDGLVLHSKGAPEALLGLCDRIQDRVGEVRELDSAGRDAVIEAVAENAREGLRVLAVAERSVAPDEPMSDRERLERDMCLLGLVMLLDPPRAEVKDAVRRCHTAGIRVLVVTGDHGLTAAAIARRVGIGHDGLKVVSGEEVDAMSDADLDRLLRGGQELVFSRSSPESKLRIAESLREEGHVVAMTGDGVNDAPALRQADIGVAMGVSGTDVAREASTVVLTDDNFATIVDAVEAGRRVYDNVRKFIVYIFAHATPEVVPFLVFALSGGSVPLAITVILILAIDVGTETLPALALGREPAEPGLMTRRPRKRSERIVNRGMLARAWLFLGGISSVLQFGAFLWVLERAGWSPGDPVGEGTPLHSAYLQAVTLYFFSMVMCQIGVAFATRTERASLRSVGVLRNRLLLAGVAFELALAAILIYLPPVQGVMGTAALGPEELLVTLPFPFIVWGADELRRAWLRRRSGATLHSQVAN